MSNSKEICDNLLQLHSMIESIRANDMAETSFALEKLNDELDQISKNLYGCSCELSLIKKKDFSFLKVFGLENNELLHSCILAWLFDPLESHNLGPLFAKRFFERLGLKMDNFDFSKLLVERETSNDNSRSDIRIWDSLGKFQCVIENKIWSSEGFDQTSRLYADFHNPSYERELFVFLSLDQKSKPTDEHFISMNYESVLEILTELMELSKGDTRFLIKHYSNTLGRLIMSEKFEGFSERTQLYYQYFKDTWEIKKAFENDRKLLLETLEEALKERKWWDETVWNLKRSGSDITVWKDSWYLNKREGVYIQLYMYIESPGFAIRIYGEPSEFAAKVRPIFKRLVNEKYPEEILGGLRKTFGTGYTRFLEKEIYFSPTEKTQIKKMLENLDKIIELFDEMIIKSVNKLTD